MDNFLGEETQPDIQFELSDHQVEYSSQCNEYESVHYVEYSSACNPYVAELSEIGSNRSLVIQAGHLDGRPGVAAVRVANRKAARGPSPGDAMTKQLHVLDEGST
jgi:hypothetical protein